jgi:GTPase SAR1 family protein
MQRKSVGSPGLSGQTFSLCETQYADSGRKLNEIIKKLRDAGTEEVIGLPKIAVIGNQSSGKSSLLEAISQITVPRASGTCTRCPMEVILRTSHEPWHGTVSLRLGHDNLGGETWISPFGETSVKEDIEKMLLRAQLALLNPSRDHMEFASLSDHGCDSYVSTHQFSANTVVLEITGADVDVTLIDLPGIISNVANVMPYFTPLIV